jgi:hypothetical protein
MENQMHRNLKAYAALAVVMIASASAPAFAAGDAAKFVEATKTDIVPVASVTAMVGKWNAADLSVLDKAASIKVFDTKVLYPAADQKKIASAETSKAADLTKLRTAIKADKGLSGMLAAKKVDVNRVIAVTDQKSGPQIFLY